MFLHNKGFEVVTGVMSLRMRCTSSVKKKQRLISEKMGVLVSTQGCARVNHRMTITTITSFCRGLTLFGMHSPHNQ